MSKSSNSNTEKGCDLSRPFCHKTSFVVRIYYQEVLPIIIRTLDYVRNSQSVKGKHKEIIIEHLVPVFSEEERIENLKNIENGLYEIFEKYTGNQSNRIAN